MKVELSKAQADLIKKLVASYIKTYKLSPTELQLATSVLEALNEAEKTEFLHECGVEVITPF